MTVALIDYGAGNLHSVANALKAAGARDIAVTADPDIVSRAERIVLPGVGSFGACYRGLGSLQGMVQAIERNVFGYGAPFLGICVGMQLMAERGEELGEQEGLGWFDGAVRRIAPADLTVKVPHMGWNVVRPTVGHALIEPGEAYFLHSFAYEGDGVIATTDHGGVVTAAIGHRHILGVQFHPEKSQRYGLDLLARFLEWRP
ncbi:MAG: imidazole glycerol phosphate synthase subunit HisH [Sphingomonas sp.]